MTAVRTLTTRAEFEEATSRHPVAVLDVGAGFVGPAFAVDHAGQTSVLFHRRSDHGVPGSSALATEGGLAILLDDPAVRAFVTGEGHRHLSVPRGLVGLAEARLALGPRGGAWDWTWTSPSPAPAPRTHPAAAVDSVTDYDLWSWVDEPVSDEMFRSFRRMGAFRSDSAAMLQSRRAIESTNSVRDSLAGFSEFEVPVSYPDANLGRQLSGLAALLAAGMPLHCVSMSADGSYDTHSDQVAEFDGSLKLTCDAILAFQRDLESRGLQDRVLVELWSEFGRRPEENDTGTDHGAAGAAFIIGSRASGEMVGEFPGLTTLDEDDNLRHTSDFREMYCSLLEQWLGQDAGPIIPGAGSLDRPKLVRS
mgnify:CR=1 FL=1